MIYSFGEQLTYTGFSTGTQPLLIDYILLADNGASWRVAKYGVTLSIVSPEPSINSAVQEIEN